MSENKKIDRSASAQMLLLALQESGQVTAESATTAALVHATLAQAEATQELIKLLDERLPRPRPKTMRSTTED